MSNFHFLTNDELLLIEECSSHTAIWTNPGETSFRSYLTNLTLHEHLRQLRDDVRHQPASTGKTSTEEELEGATSTEARCITRSSPHFLTFANRISVSLRTPAYRRRSYGLFSIVTVPAQPDLPASIEGGRDGAKETGLVSTQYIGLFGQWTHWGRSTTELPASEGASRIEKKNSKRAKVLAPQSWGILCMRSGRQVDEESEYNPRLFFMRIHSVTDASIYRAFPCRRSGCCKVQVVENW